MSNSRATQKSPVRKKVVEVIAPKLPDIKPQTVVTSLQREKYVSLDREFPIPRVAVAVGMSPTFINRVCGRKKNLSVQDVLLLLDQDAFKETLVPRSKVLDYLLADRSIEKRKNVLRDNQNHVLVHGNVLDKIAELPSESVQCVVTSTPYWGLRIYKNPFFAKWADGEVCPFGHEQTPEGFARHSTQVLASLYVAVARSIRARCFRHCPACSGVACRHHRAARRRTARGYFRARTMPHTPSRQSHRRSTHAGGSSVLVSSFGLVARSKDVGRARVCLR